MEGLSFWQERFLKRFDARIEYQQMENEKSKKMYESRLERIRRNQDKISKKIETAIEEDIQKDERIRKAKGQQQWNYEQRAHLKNDWL